MTKCLRVKDGKLVIWDKPLAGDHLAPFDDPVTHIDSIYFCSDFQYLSSVIEADVIINHASVSGLTGSGVTGTSAGDGSSGSSEKIADGRVIPAAHTLYTHSLGYVPPYMVLYNGEAIAGGTNVQPEDGRARLVSSYATSSIIGLKEVGFSNASTLAAVDRTYQVLIFRELAADPSKPLFHVKLGDGALVMGQGKVTEDMALLRRVTAAEATFYIPVSPTLDIRNGAVRTVSPIAGINDVGGQYNGGLLQIEAIEVAYDDQIL